MTALPLTHRELLFWIDLLSDAKPNWAALGRRSSVRPARLRDWQLDATELVAVIAVLDEDLTAAPALLSPIADQFLELRKRSIVKQLELHYASRNSGAEHRCTVVSKGGECRWETHVMRVFPLLPYEGWPPFGDAGWAVDVDDGHVRARPDDVRALIEAREEWLGTATGPLGDRPLPPSMYQACPHCGYKWRMRPRASTAGDGAALHCPSCRLSIKAGHVVGPCRKCGATWRQRGGPAPPARCPRCNEVRPVEEVT